MGEWGAFVKHIYVPWRYWKVLNECNPLIILKCFCLYHYNSCNITLTKKWDRTCQLWASGNIVPVCQLGVALLSWSTMELEGRNFFILHCTLERKNPTLPQDLPWPSKHPISSSLEWVCVLCCSSPERQYGSWPSKGHRGPLGQEALINYTAVKMHAILDKFSSAFWI